MKNKLITLSCVTILMLLLTAPVGYGQTLTTLVSFDLTNGASPLAGLVQGRDGNFYGTTPQLFGTNDLGTVFKMTPAGALTTLVAFNGTNGANPRAGLVQGNDGNFYGTTAGSGASDRGMIFKITSAGELATLVSFNGTNGAAPQAGLVQGSDGNFYGTTADGGAFNLGTVFMMTPTGVLTTLVSFDGTNGAVPEACLVQGNDGNFYGTTVLGGDSYNGTVFMVTPSGTLTNLVSFNGFNGSNPYAGLMLGSDGNFYGTTVNAGPGGGYRYGTVFMVTPSGTLTTLYTFTGDDGGDSQTGLIEGSDGNFYGTTRFGGANAEGTVFKITPSGMLKTLVSFAGINGDEPLAGLTQGSDGNFYGTTYGGGMNGCGTVFRIEMPPVLTAVSDRGKFLLSWPTNDVGWTIQTTTDLALSNWSDSAELPTLVAGRYVTTNGMTNAVQFFRLHRSQ
jgi:uncharacterized repeat protein (TIGR03803 family)